MGAAAVIQSKRRCELCRLIKKNPTRLTTMALLAKYGKLVLVALLFRSKKENAQVTTTDRELLREWGIISVQRASLLQASSLSWRKSSARPYDRVWVDGEVVVVKCLSPILPFLVLVRHEELVHLLPLELQLVVVVLLNGVRVRDGVVLRGQELFQGHQAGLGLHIGRGHRLPRVVHVTRHMAVRHSGRVHSVVVVATSATPTISCCVRVVAYKGRDISQRRMKRICKTLITSGIPGTSVIVISAHPLQRRIIPARRITTAVARRPVVSIVSLRTSPGTQKEQCNPRLQMLASQHYLSAQSSRLSRRSAPTLRSPRNLSRLFRS